MFHGSIPALVTPFAADGSVDEAALTKFVDWQIEQGSSAVVPCGTTGEAATLSFEEHYRVIEVTVQAAAGRVPVIAGCGSNDTATALRHMAKAAELGAAAALVVCPYYNKPSQAGLLAHFTRLAQSSDLPIILYNVPGRTVADLSVATTGELANLPTILGIKDASGDLARVTALRGLCPPDFVQLSGNDDLTLGYMAMGGHGCISVTANVAPRLCADFQAACANRDYAAARDLNDRLYPLHAAMFADASPGPAKYALAKLGLLGDTLRLPMTPPSDAARAAVDAALVHAGLGGIETRNPAAGHIPTGDQWTNDELLGAIGLYVALLKAPENKASLIAEAMSGPLSNRDFASLTYRLRNISAVADLEGWPILPGHSPAANVGARVTAFIKQHLRPLISNAGLA